MPKGAAPSGPRRRRGAKDSREETMRCFLLAVAIFCANAELARADWQFTRWGMTPEQVIAASGGTARIATAEEVKDNSTPGYDALVVGNYRSPPFAFRVAYQFKNRSLGMVHMTLADYSQHQSVREALEAKYGAPFDRTSDRIRTQWRDRAGGNIVELLDVSTINSLDVIYKQIAPPGASGL
jgi:hypothetical protein